MSTQQQAYDVATDAILAEMERGVLPWKQPWGSAGAPRNAQTGRLYNGFNVWQLRIAELRRGFDDPRWLTFKQAQALGGGVAKGAKSEPIIFWRFLEKVNDAGEVESRFPMLKLYRVFNVAETVGIDFPELPGRGVGFDPVGEAERIAARWTACAVRHGGDSAYYSPQLDYIQLPGREAFKSAAGYYSTRFHETVHATGHVDRLNRFTLENYQFGSESYSREELIAEMGAAFLMNHAGLLSESVGMNAAYVASWLRVLRNDRRMLLSAAGAAQRAADLILGTAKVEEPEPVEA